MGNVILSFSFEDKARKFPHHNFWSLLWVIKILIFTFCFSATSISSLEFHPHLKRQKFNLNIVSCGFGLPHQKKKTFCLNNFLLKFHSQRVSLKASKWFLLESLGEYLKSWRVMVMMMHGNWRINLSLNPKRKKL